MKNPKQAYWLAFIVLFLRKLTPHMNSQTASVMRTSFTSLPDTIEVNKSGGLGEGDSLDGVMQQFENCFKSFLRKRT